MRPIIPREYDLLKAILERLDLNYEKIGLATSLFVEELSDGGMGSLRFHNTAVKDNYRSMGKSVVEGEFTDCDGTLVSFTVNVDKNDRLFELDLWKVDFSPLQRFPKPEDIKKLVVPRR